MRIRRDELVQKRDELVARAKMAKAQTQVQTTLKNASIMDPTSELSHYEDKVRHQEALAQGMAEVNADSVDSQFASSRAPKTRPKSKRAWQPSRPSSPARLRREPVVAEPAVQSEAEPSTRSSAPEGA